MTLVVEDGSGLHDATSWASRSELISWAGARGITLPDADSTDVHLVRAMDWLADNDFRGSLIDPLQGTPFPRTIHIGDSSDAALEYPDDAVPVQLKRAQLIVATAAAGGMQLFDNTGAGQRVKRREVGPLKREYFENKAGLPKADVPGVSTLLDPFLSGGGGFTLTVARA